MSNPKTSPRKRTVTPTQSSIPRVMQAIVQDAYGPAREVLKREEIAIPDLDTDKVLVQVHATSIHVGDLVSIEGEPIIARFATGLRKPANRVPGTDIAGTVVAIGPAVQNLQIGDEVFGWCAGAWAEYASAPEANFVAKPSHLTFQQAAAVGVSATSALQLLRGRVSTGNKVLINGASGGLGSYAVQIAAALGAEVTGVSGPRNVDTVRALGAKHSIDYTEQDFTQGADRYDFILDNVANHSLTRTRGALTDTGVLQSNNGTAGGRWLGTLGTVIKTAFVSRFTRRQAPPSIKFPNRDDLIALADLIEDGKVTPLIERTYSLWEAGKAATHVGGGHARGTVVLNVISDAPAWGTAPRQLS